MVLKDQPTDQPTQREHYDRMTAALGRMAFQIGRAADSLDVIARCMQAEHEQGMYREALHGLRLLEAAKEADDRALAAAGQVEHTAGYEQKLLASLAEQLEEEACQAWAAVRMFAGHHPHVILDVDGWPDPELSLAEITLRDGQEGRE